MSPAGCGSSTARPLNWWPTFRPEARGDRSKVVGLVDAPGQRFVFSLYDAGEIWVADLSGCGAARDHQAVAGIGDQPYDALITPDGRHYIAGLFGEDGLALLDLWHPARRACAASSTATARTMSPAGLQDAPPGRLGAVGGRAFSCPAIGRHELLVLESGSWREVGRIPVHGQPIFAVANPDGRQVWVNFAHPLATTLFR